MKLDLLHLPKNTEDLLIRMMRQVPTSGRGTCNCGMEIDACKGLIPRIVFGPRNIAQVKLVVVGKNPGHPMDNWDESGKYCAALRGDTTGLSTRLLEAQSQWGYEAHLRGQLYNRHQYHRNLMIFLEKVFNTDRTEDVIDQVYVTELLKCSTPKERQNFRNSEFKPIVRKCRDDWLKRELDFFPALPVVALGRDVEFFLKELTELKDRVVYHPHPAYSVSRVTKKSADEAVARLKEYLS